VEKFQKIEEWKIKNSVIIYYMKLLNYIGLLMILTTMGLLFKRYQKKYELDPELKDNDLVKKYLLNDDIIYGKPNLWIHVQGEKNSRNWQSFNSRNSKTLNKPYIKVCIESIIKYNSDSFNIFIINDDTFSKLLEDWNIIIGNVPEPIKENVRKLGICKLLYKYGGINIPSSFLSTISLMNLYNEGIRGNKMFCVENINDSISQFADEILPDDIIMGCNKYCEKMKFLCDFVSNVVSSDYTNESKIKGTINKWLNAEAKDYKINVINGRLIGIKDVNNKYISLDDLLGISKINFDENKSGIYINEKMLDSRTKFNWFIRLSKEQIFNSNTNLGHLILLSHVEGEIN